MATEPTVYDEQGFSTFPMEEKEPRHGYQWFRGQVPNGPSGVDAGVYGDATHVGVFTVNSLGVVTHAKNVPIGFPEITDTGAGTSTSFQVVEYQTPESDQVRLLGGGNSISYEHGLGSTPHSYRWVIICEFPIADYAAFEEIPIENVQFNADPTGIAGPRSANDTTLDFYAVCNLPPAQRVAYKAAPGTDILPELAGNVVRIKAYAIR